MKPRTRRDVRRIPVLALSLGLILAWAVLGLVHCGSNEGQDILAQGGGLAAEVDSAPEASGEAWGEASGELAPAFAPPTVILISMDGTRPADVTAEALPSLLELAREGARAEALVPVDPTNTFPNHVSLVTGVRPEVHRLVNNVFIDPGRGRFTRDAMHGWIEAEPIWSIAERHGLPTASFYWVGSEGPWGPGPMGPGPRETYREFSSRTPEAEKVDQILAWLALRDPERRPRLITTWFRGADHAGHVDGPGAGSVVRALVRQDREIERLIRGLEAHGLFATTTLVIVSDHGMVAAERTVNLDRALGRAGLELSVLGIGGFATIVFDPGAKTEAAVSRAVEVAREAGLEAWPREAAPADWHVGDVRFGDIVVRAPIGTAIVGWTTLISGFHGYDARVPEMAGILFARGRGVRPGTRLGRISSLAVAPTILALLDLPIPEAMQAAPIGALLATEPGSESEAAGRAEGGGSVQ
jgi:predicted AlkP superfamily pyrophosphatase or phosphodiesterase